MSAKVRLALGSAALCGLVLLPFVVHIASRSPLARSATLAAPSSDAGLLIRRGQFDDAYAVLATIDSGHDSTATALRQYRLAICERALGQVDSAYARLLLLEGHLPPLEDYRRLWVARTLQALGESDAADAAYRRLLNDGCIAAVADSARLYLAALLDGAGNHDEALSLYESQRTASGTTPSLLFRIAGVEGHRDHESGRRKALTELMESFPAHRFALNAAARLQARTVQERYTRAQVYYRHGDDRRAISELRDLVRRNPDHELAPHASYTLGRAYARSGQLARARHTFERLHERQRWPAALYRLAGLQIRANRELDAIDTYLRFADLYPQHDLADDAMWQAAKAAERNDDFAHAGAIHARLTETFPSSRYSEDAAWGIGFSLYCQRQYPEALAIFQDLSRRAQQPHIVDQSLFWAGKAAHELRLGDEATAYFTLAASGFPRSYYASRAISLGYGEAQLTRPAAPGRGLRGEPSLDLRRVRGADHVERALLLGELGLAAAAEIELRSAERANGKDVRALRVLRDGYELLGLHDRALRLTTRLAGQEIDRLYPSYYWDEIAAAARAAQVDPYLVLSVIRQESYFNADAVSHAGAMGLMQIMPQTGRELARTLGVRPFDRRQLFDPGVSIQLGTRFLSDQMRSFAARGEGPEFPLVLAAYNAGPLVAQRWLERFPLEDQDAFVERIPYRETRMYVKKVLKNLAIYRALNGAASDA